MAEFAPTYYSVQLADSFPKVTGNYSPLKPNESGGRSRSAYFQYTTTGDENDGETMSIAFIPAGARFKPGHIGFGALATMDQVIIGLVGADGSGFINAAEDAADDPNYFLGFTNMDSAGTAVIANTSAFGLGKAIDKDCFAVLTFGDAGTGDTDPAIDIRGYVEYTLD